MQRGCWKCVQSRFDSQLHKDGAGGRRWGGGSLSTAREAQGLEVLTKG